MSFVVCFDAPGSTYHCSVHASDSQSEVDPRARLAWFVKEPLDSASLLLLMLSSSNLSISVGFDLYPHTGEAGPLKSFATLGDEFADSLAVPHFITGTLASSKFWGDAPTVYSRSLALPHPLGECNCLLLFKVRITQ